MLCSLKSFQTNENVNYSEKGNGFKIKREALLKKKSSEKEKKPRLGKKERQKERKNEERERERDKGGRETGREGSKLQVN